MSDPEAVTAKQNATFGLAMMLAPIFSTEIGVLFWLFGGGTWEAFAWGMATANAVACVYGVAIIEYAKPVLARAEKSEQEN